MAYAHVAHDCVIGDEVILANSVAVAGHVRIGTGAVIGGLSGIHQFVQVGKLAMVGAGSMVAQDIPPFCTVWGDRAKIVGLNTEGMRRRHYSAASVEALKKAYRGLFFSNKTLQQALRQALSKSRLTEEVRDFLAFIRASERGICRPRSRPEAGAAETW
jgi:UDP-N-acetylglucosamine acyltransferase